MGQAVVGVGHSGMTVGRVVFVSSVLVLRGSGVYAEPQGGCLHAGPSPRMARSCCSTCTILLAAWQHNTTYVRTVYCVSLAAVVCFCVAGVLRATLQLHPGKRRWSSSKNGAAGGLNCRSRRI
jgi:hypothetical protein